MGCACDPGMVVRGCDFNGMDRKGLAGEVTPEHVLWEVKVTGYLGGEHPRQSEQVQKPRQEQA